MSVERMGVQCESGNKFAICVDRQYYLAMIDDNAKGCRIVPYFTGRGRTLSRDFFFLEKNRKRQRTTNLSIDGLCSTTIRINRYMNSLRDNNSLVMEYVESFPVFYTDCDFVFDCELWEGKELYIENNGSIFMYTISSSDSGFEGEGESESEEITSEEEEVSYSDESNITFMRSRSITPLQRRVNKQCVEGENYDIYDWGEDYSKVRNVRGGGIGGSSDTLCDYIYMFASMLLVCALYIFIVSSSGVITYSRIKN